MGKLLEAVQAKLNELRQREQAPAPDYQADPKAAMDYIKSRNAVEFEQKKMGALLINALRKLPKEQRDEFYDRCIRPGVNGTYSKERYDEHLDPNTYNGRNNSIWIMRDGTFGQSWQRNVEVLEEFIGPEASEGLAQEIQNIIYPFDPAYPEENKLVYPLTAEIQEIKDSLPAFSPDSFLDAAILDEVKEELAYASEELRSQADRIDLSVDGVTGYQSMVNRAGYDMQNRFIKQDLEKGKFKDKFPTFNSSESSSGHFYVMNDVQLSENGPFTKEDLDEIRKVKPNVSKSLKDDIVSITNRFEKLGEEKFKNRYTVFNLTNDPGKAMFTSEQGFKLYAYWPLHEARKALEAAVKEKDMAKIRAAHYDYKETRKEYDEMLKTVRKHPTGLSTGNINSTRALPNNTVNPVPAEHLEDFAGHSQINGLFLLYALSKNTNSTPDKLLEDPVNVMEEAGKQFVGEHGASAPTAGQKLYRSLSKNICDDFSRAWAMQTAQICARAFDGVACMSDDAAERARIAGTGQLAIASGSIPVNAHKNAWEKISHCSPEQRTLLMQHAVLLPAQQFDPLAYGEEFDKPGWEQKLDTGALVDRLKREGKLDYGRLADRVDEIVQEASGCDPLAGSGYNKDRLIEASHSLFKEIIKNASPQERETEGFKKLEKYTENMLVTTDSFEQEQSELEEYMDVQLQEKKGLFLSSTNSEEHNKMVRSQNTLRFKLMQLQGKELPQGVSQEDREFLKTITLKQAYDTARSATFDYAVKKTDHGRNAHFVHNTGDARFDASMNALESMDNMADKLGLRSPAQKLIDETRLEVFSGRRERDWSDEKAEKAAAKLMYAMTVAHKGGASEEQMKMIDPKKVEMGIALIRGQDAFKQMMKNEGAAKLMDRIAEGHGNFTDAYVKGMNDVAKKNKQPVGKAPQDMLQEEKSAVWKNNPMPL